MGSLREDECRRVSKFLSGLLRHFPSKFGLEVDRYGWANLKDVVEILKRRYGVGRDVLELIVESDPKLRFEIKGEKIRARYGHSIDVEVDWSESDEVPKILYHGTNPKNLRSILREGLKPMKRREVHLSDSLIDALEVGKRHHPNPIVLVVDTECLSRFGLKVRKKGSVYTVDYVHPDCISVSKTLKITCQRGLKG